VEGVGVTLGRSQKRCHPFVVVTRNEAVRGQCSGQPTPIARASSSLTISHVAVTLNG
jgi:hypothetical protein